MIADNRKTLAQLNALHEKKGCGGEGQGRDAASPL